MNVASASIQGSVVALQSVIIEEVIHMSTFPPCSSDHAVRSHGCGWSADGIMIWNPDKIQLVPATGQVSGMVEAFADQPTLNAIVLHFVHEKLEVAPERWWGKRIFFPATTYVMSNWRPFILTLNVSETGERTVLPAMFGDSLREKAFVALYNS
ncbi:MAG: hypothetical protein KBC62_01830 [Candidatus Pacebacteria bacterium]|nr:hypothetical protein [Candidatus Paceibacterota bacterium]MBP9842721.1 hypothetical protein [Candidatus Paceibacterota bacterium]